MGAKGQIETFPTHKISYTSIIGCMPQMSSYLCEQYTPYIKCIFSMKFSPCILIALIFIDEIILIDLQISIGYSLISAEFHFPIGRSKSMVVIC